jgi:hypothetical protein
MESEKIRLLDEHEPDFIFTMLRLMQSEFYVAIGILVPKCSCILLYIKNRHKRLLFSNSIFWGKKIIAHFISINRMRTERNIAYLIFRNKF